MPPLEAAAAVAGGEAPPSFQFDAGSMVSEFAAALAPAAPAPDAAQAPTEIAFVDGRVVGQDALTIQRDGMLVVVIDANQDGLAQISELLAQHHDVKAVHILAHGDAGEMLLGNGVLDAKAVQGGKVGGWGAALAAGGDLLLYGCNVAEGEVGQTFVRQLAAATGADVGASADATGTAERGGDWTLEFTTGILESSPLAPEIDFLLRAVTGTAGADTFTFNASTSSGNTFTWGDTISGGTGNDTVDFSAFSGALTFTLTAAGSVTVSDGSNSITADGIEILIGGSGADRFVFNAAGSLTGSITGGGGTDTLDYSALATGVNVNLTAGTATSTGGVAGIENATGGSGGDTLTGSSGANVLTGGAGGDTLRGGGGADTIIGGADIDTLSYAGISTDLTFTITAVAGTINVTGLATAATGIENLLGGTGDNSYVFASGAANVAGNLNGGAGGSNTVSYASYGSAVTVNLAAQSATGITGTLSNVQNVTGSTGNDDITGDANDNVLDGGGGDDTYHFDDSWGNDTVTEDSGGGSDTLDFAAVSSAMPLWIDLAGTNGAVTVGDDPDAPGNSVSASYINNVIAGAGDDTFRFAYGFALTGGIDGGGGDDILDYGDYGGNLDKDDIDFAGGVAPGIVGAADNFEFIQHPADAVDGMQALFDALRDGFDQTIGQVTLPLIGDAISSGITTFLDEMELAMLGDGAPGGRDGLIEGLLTDDDDQSTDDIIEDKLSRVTLSHDIGSATMPATLSIVFDASQLVSDQIFEIRMVIEGTIFHEEVDIDFASALPGLGLSISSTGGLAVDLSYVLDLGIGLDFKPGGGFYIDTNGQDDGDPDDDEEFTLTLTAGVTPGTEIEATLGFLGMKLTDQTVATDTDDNPDDGRASGLIGTFAVDLLDPGTGADADGHLKFSELSGASASDLIEAHLTAEADVDVIGELDMGTDILPSISTILHYNQSFADITLAFGGGSTATFGGAPVILFEDVTLDLGTFFSGFLEPILTEIKKVTEPLQPVVDVLQAPLPIFSDLSFLSDQFNKDGDPDGEVSLLDLAGTLLGDTKYGKVVTAISAIADIIAFVNNIPTDEADGLKINMGDYAFTGTDIRVGDALKNSNAPATTNANPGAQLDSADSQIGSSGASTEKKGALAKLRSATSGFSVPLLTSPATAFSLLMGKDVTLFAYDLPELDFDFGLNIRVPLFGPLFMKLSGSVSAEIDAGFGFDTAGIRAFIASNDPADIFLKGFYLNDHWSGGTDNPEVTLTSTLAAYAAVGIAGLVEAGVGGGVTATIEFDLNDVSTSTDGKVFLNEFLFIAGTDPACIFDIHGKLEAFLETYVWVGLDLGLLGTITIFYDSWDLARVVLAEFVHHCDIADEPVLAHMNGDELVLHMGVDAAQRDGAVTDWHTGYDEESYSVNRGLYDHDDNATTAKIDRIAVSWNGFTEYYDPAAVNKIRVNDAGAGDDTITVGKNIAAQLYINGGADNDVIRAAGTGLVYLVGGGGNDKIVGNASKTVNSGTHYVSGLTRDRYEGGTGDDAVSGSGAGDEIYGGTAASAASSGNDVIKGNAGDDLIYGGDESGMTGSKANGDSIDGGNGADTIYGGAGADAIKGGSGADIIDGGAGADAITGGGGIDSLTGGAGADVFNWTSGDGADVVSGGSDGGTEPMDTFVGASTMTSGEAITLSANGAATQLAWDVIGSGAPTTLSLSGIEKFQMNAGLGGDVITINDLAGTTVREVGVGFGATVVDNVVQNSADPADVSLNTVTTVDGAADSITIRSGSGADQFTGQTTTGAGTGLTSVNMSRTGTASISYSISQADSTRDSFLLQSFAGNDSIDLSAVRVASFSSTTIESGDNNDVVFGTQFADTINSGAGNDKVSGNAGLDTFIDASGNDTLSEVNHGSPNNVYNPLTGALTASSNSTSYFNLDGANFTLNGGSLTIAHAATETENIGMFEEVALVAGSGNNTFTVQNWQNVARLDGGAGSDTYNITFAGSGAGKITENDSIHVAGDVDRMTLYGTSGVDQFRFTANNDDWQVDDDGDGVIDAGDPTVNASAILTDGSVSLLHGGSNVETVNYTHSERLEVRAGAGDDAITVDDNALQLHVYGEAGNDSFLIGRVTSSHEEPPGSGIVIADSITNGISSESFFYGDFGEVLQTSGPNANDPRNPYIDPATGKTVEINVAQSGNDSFEVNHNLAPLWLFGNAGDDRFTVNAVLIDTAGTPANPNNVSGGTGSNTITYLQNAPVNIDGGSGNDIVVVNGTGIGDTFIVAVVSEDHDSNPTTPDILRQKVVGAGLQINMKNVERLEVNGAGGDDRIHVYSTLPEIEVIISGGSGNDTIQIGGNATALVVDPPAYTIDPPAYTFDAPPYIERWESVSWSWGGYWYFNWTWPLWHYQPVVTYTSWYPVWIDPPAVTIDPPPSTYKPPAFQFSAGPSTVLTGIDGKLRIEAGDLDSTGGLNDNDRIVVHNQSGSTASTGLMTSGDHDDDALSADVGYLEGLGMQRPVYAADGVTITGSTVGGIYYLGAENLDVHLNDNAAASDNFTIAYTDPNAITTVFLGAGNDQVRIKAVNGVVQFDGGAGNDQFNVWNDLNLLSDIVGTLRINGGAGIDSVDVRDTADTTGDTGTLSASGLTGLDMAGSIQYGAFATQTFTYLNQFQTLASAGPPAVINSVNNAQVFTYAYAPIENLTISLGSGDDVFNVTGTQAVTTINANAGNDTVNVSSDGATLQGSLDAVNGALTLHLGAGNNTLNVSDFGDADADAAVSITSSTIAGLAPALITYDTSSRFTGGVNIWAGRGSDVVGIASTLLADVTTFYANDGDDAVTVANLTGGSNRLLSVHGDAGDDRLDASAIAGTNVTVVLFGDSGQEIYAGADKALLNLTGVASVVTGNPGNDTLFSGIGPSVLVGGGNNAASAANGGRDRLTGAGSTDVLIGDNGTASFSAGIVTQFASMGTAGGDDQIDAGEGRNYVIGGVGADTVTAGASNDVVLGDNGIVNFTSLGVITDATVTEVGLGGIDTITVDAGDNVVLAGAGGDTVTTLGGVDVVIGDSGQATWTGGVLTQIRSSDVVAGTGGGDTIDVGAGRNYVVGGVGADGIAAGADDDVVFGDNGIANFTAAGIITDATATELGVGGIDTIDAGGGNNVVVGGAAGDAVTSAGGNDTILGDNGNLTFTSGVLTAAVTTDTSDATGGNDVLVAGDGTNVVLGGVGSDTITTGSGDDVIVGDNGIAQFSVAGARLLVESRDPLLEGDDTIDAGAGNDVVIGGSGADTLNGGTGNDVLIGDGGTATFSAGSLFQVVGDSTFGDADFISGGGGNDILLGGAGNDTMSANLTEDLFTGGNARITFAGGLVTTIEVLDGVDLILQALFDSYTDTGGGEAVVVEDNVAEGGGGSDADAQAALLNGFGTEGIFASDGTLVLPGLGSLTFSFGRGVPLAQLPELLRNIVLELSLGAGNPPPAHGGEGSGNQGAPAESQGGNAQAAESLTLAPLPFAVEAEVSTLQPAPAAETSPAQDSVALAAGVAALTGLRASARRMEVFDPATGRLAERDAVAAPIAASLDRTRFAPRGIDW